MRLPRLVRFLLFHAACGAAAAAVVTAGIIWTDTAGMGTIIERSDNAFTAIFMMFAGLTITLSSFAMGIAVMSLAEGPQNTTPEGGDMLPEPIRIRAGRRRDRR